MGSGGRQRGRHLPFFMALSMSRSSSLAWLFWGSVCSSPRTYFRAFSYSYTQKTHTQPLQYASTPAHQRGLTFTCPGGSSLYLHHPLPHSSPTQWSRVHKQPQLCGDDKLGEITTQGPGLHPNPDVTFSPHPRHPDPLSPSLSILTCYHLAPLYPIPSPAYCSTLEERKERVLWPIQVGWSGKGALSLTLSR